MFNWFKRFKAWRVEQRRKANRLYIASGAPCHDPEFWQREKDYL